MNIYTGIGSSSTPINIMLMMTEIAKRLAKLDYILRSGGAPGADTAFEVGCDAAKGKKEIFLPWQNCNNNKSQLHVIPPQAVTIASQTHPKWKYLRLPVKKLMSRNVQQILGLNCDHPTEFVVCWTEDGCINLDQRTKETGGTGQAIAIASSRNIPIYNLQRSIDQDMVAEKIEQMETKCHQTQ